MGVWERTTMRQGVAAIGMCSWDRFLVTDRYPGPGEYAIVRHQFEQSGGTTSNLCAALTMLGVPALLASRVGGDPEGRQLIEVLGESGCDVSHVVTDPASRTDTAYIVISGSGDATDRTIYWIQGAKPKFGDPLPVAELLDHRWLVVDVDDARLRSFWLDQPAHNSPRTRLIGPLTYLVEMDPAGGLEHALRFDYAIGNARELLYLTGAANLNDACEVVRASLPGQACQAVFVSQGAAESLAIREGGITSVPTFPIDVIDTTGAGDAFAAGCIWGLIDCLDDREILRRGNALGGLACRALGARAGLPTQAEVLQLLNAEKAVP